MCRINGREPALSSDILLYDSITGHLLALMDGDWITTMRTGAVAALSIDKLKKSDTHTFSFIGLGNTARATAMCLLSLYANKDVKFRLLRYKDQADSFIERFQEYTNALFEIVDTVQELISGAEIIISCITDASDLICTDNTLYNKGVYWYLSILEVFKIVICFLIKFMVMIEVMCVASKTLVSLGLLTNLVMFC